MNGIFYIKFFIRLDFHFQHLTDNPHIYKLDNRVITYYELCLFSFIRNRNANLDDFHFPIRNLKDENIGYDIFEVLHLFIKYVKKPEYIEHLILMHRYISSIWKNGSLFLC